MNRQSTMSEATPLLAVMVSSVLFGCASTSGTRPEDMSAKSHAGEAAQHTEKAEEHAEKAQEQAPGPGWSEVVAGSDFAFEGGEFNPSEGHNTQAKRHARHTEEHLAAAEALVADEEEACKSIAPESRSWCPLLGPVVATENTPHGVRIAVEEGTNIEELIARIRCHVAFANTHGRQGMDRCPLYVKGVEVERAGPDAIELTAKRKAEVRELQKRVAEHIGE